MAKIPYKNNRNNCEDENNVGLLACVVRLSTSELCFLDGGLFLP